MKLSRVNTSLLIGIILINGITVGLPFVPALLFQIEAHGGAKQQKLYDKIETGPDASQPNSLIMPTALFDQQIYDGPDASTLRSGVWRRPQSSTPDKGGNTVLAAHRFTYDSPRGAFYNLDKLRVGDPLALIWNNKTYHYTVQETKIVGPHDDYIENATNVPRLTLYTCTPLTLPKDRLVVIAMPTEVRHE